MQMRFLSCQTNQVGKNWDKMRPQFRLDIVRYTCFMAKNSLTEKHEVEVENDVFQTRTKGKLTMENKTIAKLKLHYINKIGRAKTISSNKK